MKKIIYMASIVLMGGVLVGCGQQGAYEKQPFPEIKEPVEAKVPVEETSISVLPESGMPVPVLDHPALHNEPGYEGGRISGLRVLKAKHPELFN